MVRVSRNLHMVLTGAMFSEAERHLQLVTCSDPSLFEKHSTSASWDGDVAMRRPRAAMQVSHRL